LFRYLNEQAAEIERIQNDIQALQEEGARYEAEEGDDSNERDEIVEIESRIRSTEEQTAAYETKCISYQKLLDEVKDEVKASTDELFYFKFKLTNQANIVLSQPTTAFTDQT
jgi:chromosome segregation ATPase